MTRASTISRGARGFVLAGAIFLFVAAVAAFRGEPRATIVALSLHGFVLHTLFGKAYSLVPSYFDRDLAAPWAPLLQLPFAAAGAVALALPADSAVAEAFPADAIGADLAAAGGLAWALGAAIFLGTIAATIRDNPTGAETGTGEAKQHLARLDRRANAAMPIALVYLAAGAYQLAVPATGLPALTDTGIAGSHLLAVGTAALFVFAIGARLLPRLLRADLPDALGSVVLTAGAIGPALLVAALDGGVAGIPETPLLHGAIMLLSIAILGHALAAGLLVWGAPSPRLGAYGVAAGAAGGVLAVAAGAAIQLDVEPALLVVHPRLALFGFLGLTILGVAYHFYPPTIAGEYGDEASVASMALIAAGLLLELGAVLAGGFQADQLLLDVARGLVVLGAGTYLALVAVIFYRRG